MARFATALAFILAFVVPGISQEPNHEKEKESQDLRIGVWKVPPGFISAADPSDKNGERKPLPGFKSKQNPYAVQFDGVEFLKKNGIQFPPGSDAVYDQSTNVLVVRNTLENLDIMDALLSGCGMGTWYNVVVEISTYECTRPSGSKMFTSEWPTYSDLQKLPATDIKLMDHVSTVTKSGRRTQMNHVLVPAGTKPVSPRSDQAEADAWGLFRDGESGTMVEVEPTVGPDANEIDASVNYHFRTSAAGKVSSEISFTTEFSGWESYPIVIHVSPVQNQEEKFFVVTGNVRMVNYGGWNLKELGSADSDAKTD